MRATWIAPAAVLVGVLAGCSKAPEHSIVGKWVRVDASFGDKVEREFRADGTYSFSSVGSRVWFKSHGTYRLEPDELVTVQKEIALSNGTVDKRSLEQRLPIEWLSEDRFREMSLDRPHVNERAK